MIFETYITDNIKKTLAIFITRRLITFIKIPIINLVFIQFYSIFNFIESQNFVVYILYTKNSCFLITEYKILVFLLLYYQIKDSSQKSLRAALNNFCVVMSKQLLLLEAGDIPDDKRMTPRPFTPSVKLANM